MTKNKRNLDSRPLPNIKHIRILLASKTQRRRWRTACQITKRLLTLTIQHANNASSDKCITQGGGRGRMGRAQCQEGDENRKLFSTKIKTAKTCFLFIVFENNLLKLKLKIPSNITCFLYSKTVTYFWIQLAS